MAISLNDFRRKHKGRRVSGYTSRGGQCVDLARAWVENLTCNAYKGLPRVIAAKEMFDAADARVWRKVRNSPQGVPPVGAVVVFARGRWGHVAIARAGCTTTKLLTFDQNWSVSQRCTDETHGYTAEKVIGWLIKR